MIVYSVQVYNRMECCSWRLSNALIKIFQSAKGNKIYNEKMCGNIGYMKLVPNRTIICSEPIHGYGVQIEDAYLSICEIFIKGRHV